MNFSELLACPAGDFSGPVRSAIAEGAFDYVTPEEGGQEAIRNKVSKYLDEGLTTVSDKAVSADRKEMWERCYDQVGVIPPFLVKEKSEPFRLHGEYVIPDSIFFETHVWSVIRAHLFNNYFQDVGLVAEFGCGTGHNLLALAKQRPDLYLIGFDWAEAAVRSVKRLSNEHELKLIGKQFNFFAPDPDQEYIHDSGVLTVGALEQVGTRFNPFLAFLLHKRPAVVVHLEPVVELYTDSAFDQLAVRYHKARGYLEGFLPELRKLEEHKEIKVLKVQRMQFGSFYHEAYTCIAWRPL